MVWCSLVILSTSSTTAERRSWSIARYNYAIEISLSLYPPPTVTYTLYIMYTYFSWLNAKKRGTAVPSAGVWLWGAPLALFFFFFLLQEPGYICAPMGHFHTREALEIPKWPFGFSAAKEIQMYRNPVHSCFSTNLTPNQHKWEKKAYGQICH